MKLAAIALMAGLTGVAHGQMTYLSSSRVVRAETGGGIETFSFTSPGVWNSQATSTNLSFATATATQVGDLRPDGISFESHTAATNMNGFVATCTSDLDTTFSITNATLYEIVRGPNSGAAFMVRLTLGTATIFDFNGTTIQGVLQPGLYRFQARLTSTASATIPDHTMNQNIDFDLNIPTPSTAAALFVGVSVASTRRRRS